MQKGQDIAFTKKNFSILLDEKSAMEARIAELEGQLAKQEQEFEKALQEFQEKYQLTKEQLEWLRRQMYGRKTERFVPSDSSQLGLEFENLMENAPAELGYQEIKYKKKKGGKQPGQGRNQLPAHLKRVEEEINIDDLPEGAVKIGEEQTEILEIQEGKVYVRKIIRPKYALPEDGGVAIAPMPALPIPKGIAGASVLAYILSNKYVYHLPLHRSLQMFKRYKVDIAQSTICDWVKRSSELLIPLYDLQRNLIWQSGYVSSDETTIKVLDENKKGTHLGYYWAFCSTELNMICFDYQKGRGSKVPKAFFKGYSGIVQSDAYAGYDALEGEEYHITLLGCMAHVRRKFDEAKKNDYNRAKKALELFKGLYMIEREAKEANMGTDERKALRDQKATPILFRLYRWLLKNNPKNPKNKVMPASKIGIAIAYALNNRYRIKRCYESGRHEIDNNYVENKIRPIAIGRKNYMFAGSHDAAQRAAVVYSMIATCKAHDIDPTDWLHDVMARIPTLKVNQMEQLLPSNWTPLTQDNDN